MVTLDRSKETFLRYRDRAREIYQASDTVVLNVKIPLHANVQVCEGGAFVEAVVWVPEEKICEHDWGASPLMWNDELKKHWRVCRTCQKREWC